GWGWREGGRGERPDGGAGYMTATQAMTGQGGWPMTVFATPDGRPFYCGTYFPDRPRHGMPSFRQLLASVSSAWRERRDQIEQVGADVAAKLGETARLQVDDRSITNLEDTLH